MKGLKWMVSILLGAYLLLLAALSLPGFLGFEMYAVISGSMAPQIPVGAAVYVKPERFENIKVGDIITFSVEGGSMKVTHRVLKKDEQQRSFITMGDANEQQDGHAVLYEDVSGVVRFSAPFLGYIAAALGDTGEKVLLAGILAWLLLVREALENMIEVKEKGVHTI